LEQLSACPITGAMAMAVSSSSSPFCAALPMKPI